MRSTVVLPAAVEGDYEVYINGVLQEPYVDFEVHGRALVFDRPLRKDRISGWRWLLGAWGIGTYRPDDTVDIRYEIEGQARLAHDLTVTILDDKED